MNLSAVSVIPILCLLLLPAGRFAAAETVEKSGVSFQRTTELGDQPLPLRGTHTLKWLWWKVYTGGFYTEEDRQSFSAILEEDAPRVLILHYHRSINAKDIQQATEKALRANPTVDMPALQERLDTLYSCYSDVGDGDEYRIEYHPDQEQTRILLNGEPQCTIEGADFAEAFFAIWVSSHSLKPDLADDLAGVDG